MKKEEARILSQERSRLIIEYITSILSDKEKVEGTMIFNHAKIDNQSMIVLDIYVPKRKFEKHLNLGITSDHELVLYDQLLNDLLDTFLEHETMGVTKYYWMHSMLDGFFSGINAVNSIGSNIKINLNARGEDFKNVIDSYTKRYDEFVENLNQNQAPPRR